VTEPVSVMTTLWPVIVGGVIGVTGGLAGPPLTHWLSEKSNQKKKCAEKLEELMCVLYEHEHWLQVVRQIRIYGNEMAEPPTPYPRAEAIIAVYFPQFSGHCSELEVVARSFEKWMITAAQKRLSGKGGDEVINGFLDAYEPYRRKFVEVVSTIKDFALSEFAIPSRKVNL